VEEQVHSRSGEKRRWRKATLTDLAEPEMRALIDLRFKPQFFFRAPERRPADGDHSWSPQVDSVPHESVAQAIVAKF
jgi:hypothetical protein